MVNLEWFRTFKVIYEKGTLTAAAQSLFISQPGVSLHLSSLESNLGVTLFERIAKKMVPTEHGKVLYNSLIEPLTKLQDVERKFQRSAVNNIPTVTIGMCFETFQHTLEKHLHTFDFNVITQFSDYASLLQQLNKGIVDVVVTSQKTETQGIEHIPFYKESIVMIASNDIDKTEFLHHLNDDCDKEIIEWLLKNKWYGASSDNEHFTRFWQNNFHQTPNFRQNFIVPNFNSIIRGLTLGKGLAIVPDFLCKEAVEKGDLQLLWKGRTLTSNQLYFAFRKNSIYKTQIDLILNIFRKEMK